MKSYSSPPWLFGGGALGGNAQTIWPALYGRRFHGPAPSFDRTRLHTPDGDFIDFDWLQGDTVRKANAPLLVLFHGLEGSSGSHYAQAFANWARQHGWGFVVPHFRGCSGELNWAPRAYHSGDFEEIGWMLAQCRARHQLTSTGPIFAVGISLGGNALLRWAEEAGESAARTVSAVAAVSSPIDLAAGGHAIGRGFNRQVYTRMFLRSMVPKALRKLDQHPGLFSRERLSAARNLYEFDNVFTAPLHGFKDTADYWKRGSAQPHLAQIRIPTLVLNARNDPFVPGASLPQASEVGQHVTLWQPAHGGHVGFPSGKFPSHVMALPQQVMDWMNSVTNQATAHG
jgi:uncharacterized protein